MSEFDLFIEAFQRSDPVERAAYLDRACAGDGVLRGRVEQLLEADAGASEVLEAPAPFRPNAAQPDMSSGTTETEFARAADSAGTLPLAKDPGDARADATQFAPSADSAGTLPLAEDPGDARAPTTEFASSAQPAGTLLLAEGPGDASTNGTTFASRLDQSATLLPAEEPGTASDGGTELLSTVDQFDSFFTRDRTRSSPSGSLELTGLAQYEPLAELGRGGMGVVYKVRHRALHRIVALKMILDGKHAHSEHRERFRIEAEAVARLRHPNIVQIYDFGDADGCPFVTLEMLEGGSLADRLEGTTQSNRAAAELVATLARAMHAAHQAGIVHRDLKPPNILFDRDGTPKITDFGLAKRLEVEEGHTRTGQIMGTPSYMAPEQAQGHVHMVGPPADIYALGAILYEMLTGRPPFKASSGMSTLHQVVYDDVVPPSRIEPRIARDLETICLKCLEKEPQKRFGTALELADDLRRYLDNLPIRARRTPLWERGAKWVRRRPTTATLLALGTAAAVVLAIFGLHRTAQLKARALENAQQLKASALADSRQLAQRRAESERVLEDSQTRLLARKWADGQLIRNLSHLVTGLKAEPRLAAIRGLAVRMLEQAEKGLRDEEDGRRDRERRRNFVQRCNVAYFDETNFTGLDLPADPRATRAAAREALAVFADSGPDDAWSLAALPRTFSRQEQAEIEDGCYALLLVLAEAVAQKLPGEDPVVQADRGLRILDRAARLRSEPTRAYHSLRAACLACKGDKTGEAREMAEAQRLRSTTAHDHFLDGHEMYKRGNWSAALARFDTVLRLQPDHFWALCLGAIASIQTNQPDVAKLGLNDCIKQQPRFAWLFVLRGFASGQSAVQARAAAAGRTLKIGDGSIEAQVEAQFDAAEDDYRQALALLDDEPNDELRYAVLNDRALLRFQRNRLDASVADLEAAIRLNGREYNAFANLAKILQGQKKWDQAVEKFTQAIALKPKLAPLYRSRAEVYQEREDQSPAHRVAALSDLENAIRHEKRGDSVLADHLTAKGRLLRREERYEDALVACDAALKGAPDFETAHRLRVWVLLDLNRHEEVIRACDGALAQGKPWPDIHLIRGNARASRGDFSGAIDDYSHALVLQPGEPRVLIARGLAYLFSDSPQPALHDFDEALRRDVSNGEAHSGRGRALALLGDHRAAIAAAEESLCHDRPTARRANNAARIYAQAAIAAAKEVGEKRRLAVLLVDRYQDRAVALVKLALERTPAELRAAFWQDQVAADPTLRSLHHRLRSLKPATGGAATLSRIESERALAAQRPSPGGRDQALAARRPSPGLRPPSPGRGRGSGLG